jgi:mRNA-degrading endonuclease toxin of MazEF toxin-antitoxin module
LTPSAGEIWLADTGEEQRRPVFVVSDDRFQRLAARALIAPVFDEMPTTAPPWLVPAGGGRAIAVNLLGTTSIERLLERVDTPGYETLRRVRHAVRAIAG